jgi:hypothetical protein
VGGGGGVRGWLRGSFVIEKELKWDLYIEMKI